MEMNYKVGNSVRQKVASGKIIFARNNSRLKNKILPIIEPGRENAVQYHFVLFYRALVEYFLPLRFLTTPLLP
jgi:hypothetical protein